MNITIVRNVTREVVIYNVTSLRVDPDYMYYYIHWTRWGNIINNGIILYYTSINVTIIVCKEWVQKREALLVVIYYQGLQTPPPSLSPTSSYMGNSI